MLKIDHPYFQKTRRRRRNYTMCQREMQLSYLKDAKVGFEPNREQRASYQIFHLMLEFILVLSGTPCELPVDFFIESSDGKYLGAHVKNLSVLTQDFPGIEASQSVIRRKSLKVVKLPEDSRTLRLFLEFMHNVKVKVPDLSLLSTCRVGELAKAAEKYGNGYALMACKRVLPFVFRTSSQLLSG